MKADYREFGAVQQPHSVMLTDREVAARLGVTVHTVRKWRLHGLGPLAIRVGGAVRYRLSDVESWLQSQPRVGGTPEGV